jgi:hypothetical protein
MVAALLSATVLTALTGCSSAHSRRSLDIGRRLALPGSTYSALSAHDRNAVARYCLQAAAAAAGRADRTAVTPTYSDRYHAVASLNVDRLSSALSRWFASAAHARETVQEGCTEVAASLARVERFAQGPYARFSSAVASGEGILALHSLASSLSLSARVVPRQARLLVGRALDRAPNGIVAHVGRRGALAVITLRRIPPGRSYLRLQVIGRGRRWRRLMVLDRGRAPLRAGDRRRLLLHGSGPTVLRSLSIPAGWSAITTTSGAPLTVTSGDTLILVYGAADGRRPLPLPAGHYTSVKVIAAGRWTVTLGPPHQRPHG